MPSAVDLSEALASISEPCETDEVVLWTGQLYVVAKGVRHQPYSKDGADVLLIEPSTTVNTGDTPSLLTAERRVRYGARSTPLPVARRSSCTAQIRRSTSRD